MDDVAFTILTVCTGNICRSPMAEQLLRSGLADSSVYSITSAGTIAVSGAMMPEPAVTWSRRLGGDPAHHLARRLIESQVVDADLVLAMSREHRSAVARLAPRASGYTFTIREFARLSEGIGDRALDDAIRPYADNVWGRLHATVALVASQRGFVEHPRRPADDDVVDPFGRRDSTYARTARQLAPAVEAVADLLLRASKRGSQGAIEMS